MSNTLATCRAAAALELGMAGWLRLCVLAYRKGETEDDTGMIRRFPAEARNRVAEARRVRLMQGA